MTDRRTFEQRVAALEAREAIRDLVTSFGRGADAYCDPAALAPLFTPDAQFDVGGFGLMTGGGEAIAATMKSNNVRGFYWSLHYLLTPMIMLDSALRRATVFFYYWGVTRTHPDNGSRSFWVGGTYDGEVVQNEGAWQFRRLKLNVELLSPYGEGFSGPITSFDEV